MLNEHQMKVIREEELFREEVRKDIEKKRVPQKEGLWHFANSAFGLWLLSSVALGSLGFLYGYVQDQRSAKRDAQERVSRLRFEIATHGRDFLQSFDSAHDYRDYSIAFGAHLQRPRYKLSDFKDATMDQLLWEYRHLANDPTKADSVQGAIEWVWQDIYSMRTELRLDSETKRWFDDDMKARLVESLFPALEDRHP
jgi:hypothetical protein